MSEIFPDFDAAKAAAREDLRKRLESMRKPKEAGEAPPVAEKTEPAPAPAPDVLQAAREKQERFDALLNEIMSLLNALPRQAAARDTASLESSFNKLAELKTKLAEQGLASEAFKATADRIGSIIDKDIAEAQRKINEAPHPSATPAVTPEASSRGIADRYSRAAQRQEQQPAPAPTPAPETRPQPTREQQRPPERPNPPEVAEVRRQILEWKENIVNAIAAMQEIVREALHPRLAEKPADKKKRMRTAYNAVQVQENRLMMMRGGFRQRIPGNWDKDSDDYKAIEEEVKQYEEMVDRSIRDNNKFFAPSPTPEQQRDNHAELASAHMQNETARANNRLEHGAAGHGHEEGHGHYGMTKNQKLLLRLGIGVVVANMIGGLVAYYPDYARRAGAKAKTEQTAAAAETPTPAVPLTGAEQPQEEHKHAPEDEKAAAEELPAPAGETPQKKLEPGLSEFELKKQLENLGTEENLLEKLQNLPPMPKRSEATPEFPKRGFETPEPDKREAKASGLGEILGGPEQIEKFYSEKLKISTADLIAVQHMTLDQFILYASANESRKEMYEGLIRAMSSDLGKGVDFREGKATITELVIAMAKNYKKQK